MAYNTSAEIREAIGVKLEGVDYDRPFDESDERRDALDAPFEEDQRKEPVFLDDEYRCTYDQGFIEGGKGAGPSTIVIRNGRTMHEQRSPTAVRVIFAEAANEETMQRIAHGTATAECPRKYALKRRRTLTPEQKLHHLQGTPIPHARVASLSEPEAKARRIALTHKGQQIPVSTL